MKYTPLEWVAIMHLENKRKDEELIKKCSDPGSEHFSLLAATMRFDEPKKSQGENIHIVVGVIASLLIASAIGLTIGLS